MHPMQCKWTILSKGLKYCYPSCVSTSPGQLAQWGCSTRLVYFGTSCGVHCEDVSMPWHALPPCKQQTT